MSIRLVELDVSAIKPGHRRVAGVDVASDTAGTVVDGRQGGAAVGVIGAVVGVNAQQRLDSETTLPASQASPDRGASNSTKPTVLSVATRPLCSAVATRHFNVPYLSPELAPSCMRSAVQQLELARGAKLSASASTAPRIISSNGSCSFTEKTSSVRTTTFLDVGGVAARLARVGLAARPRRDLHGAAAGRR